MLKILIVDDEPNILLGLKKLIDWNLLGYEDPALFNNPFDALDAIRYTDYDVFITDIRMPQLSGLELMEEARKIRNKIKIIVLSSYSDYEYMHKALIEKAANYLLKPVQEEELIETLKQLVLDASSPENTATHLNESYAKVYDNLKTIFDTALLRLKEDVIALNKDQIHSELLLLENEVRRVCSFRPAETIIVENYNAMLKDLQKLLETTLILKKGTICADLMKPSFDTLTELTEAAIRSVDSLLESCLEACTAKAGGIMDTVELYIQLNYNKPLTLAAVSRKFFFSPSYFSYTFSKGRDSFLSYLNKVRLRHGALLLTETEDTIAIIAGKIGYNSEKLFYKTFKSEYKCTPTQYRINAQQKQ